MKTLQTLALGAVVAVGLTYNAKADTITPLAGNPFTVSDQNTSTILAAANAAGVDAPDNDLSVDVRFSSGNGAGGTSPDTTHGTFSVTTIGSNDSGQEEITFSVNPGFVLAGLALHDGGGNIDNFYSVNDETSGTNEGAGILSTPSNGGGSPGALSNLDFLLEASPVPEPGTAVMLLLGGALAGLVHRRFGRR